MGTRWSKAPRKEVSLWIYISCKSLFETGMKWGCNEVWGQLVLPYPGSSTTAIMKTRLFPSGALSPHAVKHEAVLWW